MREIEDNSKDFLHKLEDNSKDFLHELEAKLQVNLHKLEDKLSKKLHELKVRDYFLPVNLLRLAEVVYQAKETKGHVSLPLKAASDSDYRLYCLDTGFFAYQSDISLIDFQNLRNTNMGVSLRITSPANLLAVGVTLFYWRGKITQSLNI